MKLCYLDFEFNGVTEKNLNLVSVSALCTEGGETTYVRDFWLYEGESRKAAKSFFSTMITQGYTFVAFVVEAEARGLLSLFGTDRTWLKEFKAIDLYLEYRNLLNHNNRLAYGKQFISGEIMTTTPPPPKWERLEQEEDDGRHHKPSFSLAAAIYKLLGVVIDAQEKNEVRDIIIAGVREAILDSRERIMRYNKSDIDYLPKLLSAIWRENKNSGLTLDDWVGHALTRGDYAVQSAIMLSTGYPVNLERIKKFASKTKEILSAAAKECIQEASGQFEPFRFDKRQQRFVANEKGIREWIENKKIPRWRKTEKGKLSISKDAFGDYYSSADLGFAGAYTRYLKTKQSLNGFSPNASKKGTFFDFVGTDRRARPHFGIYGSQSSRSQPGATGFIPLKAHWMRNFIEAPPGRAIAGVDYASQEFLIAAILSQDKIMMQAYASGDVYLAFAKAAKLAPEDATSESHKSIRDAAKQIVLGISYDMSASGLAPRLEKVLARPVGEPEAQGYIDSFFDIYGAYADWKEEVLIDYQENDLLRLPDGWTMWGDNTNRRSVANFPVQGHGAVIMRDAVRRAHEAGLEIIYTLHDALYIEYKSFCTEDIKCLQDCMLSAFESVMSRYGKTVPIRLEAESWSVDYKNSEPAEKENIVYSAEYSSVKANKDLERYKPFFN